MAEETQAVSSPAEVEDVFGGQQVSMAEFQKYRTEGELPERFKPAETVESGPTDTPEQTATTEGENPEPAPDSDPDDLQGLKPKTAKRIQQLLAKTQELERKLAEKQDVKTEPSPAPAAQTTRPKPTVADKNPDGTPKFAEYEDYIEELADWKAEQRIEAARREQSQQEAVKVVQTKLDEARARYDDADDVIFPTSQAIQDAKIPDVVKQALYGSKVYIDLCYVLGGDDELKKFISLANSDPREAIGKVFEYERGIKEELSKPRDDKGQFVGEKAPETKKTAAPKPPSPVGGASSRAFDVSDESLSPDEWARKRTKELNQRNN